VLTLSAVAQLNGVRLNEVQRIRGHRGVGWGALGGWVCGGKYYGFYCGGGVGNITVFALPTQKLF
jgi:hypothetical protein